MVPCSDDSKSLGCVIFPAWKWKNGQPWGEAFGTGGLIRRGARSSLWGFEGPGRGGGTHLFSCEGARSVLGSARLVGVAIILRMDGGRGALAGTENPHPSGRPA